MSQTATIIDIHLVMRAMVILIVNMLRGVYMIIVRMIVMNVSVRM